MKEELFKEDINNIFIDIKKMIINSRNRVYAAVNNEMLNLYWNIGKIIIDIQKGKERAEYGDYVIEKLSKKINLGIWERIFSREFKENETVLFMFFNLVNSVDRIELVSLY